MCTRRSAMSRHSRTPSGWKVRTTARTRSPSARRSAASPQGRQGRYQLKSPAAFLVTVGMADPRHARPALVGDFHRTCPPPARTVTVTVPPGSTRAAMPHTVTEQLARQQDRNVPARVPRKHRTDEDTGYPRRLSPPRQASRSPGPLPEPSAHPPCPPGPAPGRSPGPRTGRRPNARSTQQRTSSRNTTPARPVRGRPWKTDGAHRPLRPPLRPSAICPWTPQHAALQRYEMTHHGAEENGPHSREFPASGPFSQSVAGVGSNQRRLSRRFYIPEEAGRVKWLMCPFLGVSGPGLGVPGEGAGSRWGRLAGRTTWGPVLLPAHTRSPRERPWGCGWRPVRSVVCWAGSRLGSSLRGARGWLPRGHGAGARAGSGINQTVGRATSGGGQ
jgi:hypothetical protein